MSSSSSTSESPTPSQSQQQQQRKPRKPLFADWPTIKILTPPQGRFSPKTDEWCFTYCTQSVSGRIKGAEPDCHYTCIRKVFPHEVRNVLSFKKHKDVGPDGKAKYPLPIEGQPAHLPRVLGGTSKSPSDEPSSSSASPKYWDEGWYLATGHGRWAAFQKMDSMFYDLEKRSRIEAQLEGRKEIWQDYQDKLKQGVGEGSEKPQMWWASIMRPNSPPLHPHPSSLLVPLPPDFPPLMDKITKFLAPSYRVLTILHESITSGEQKQFALRLWEKAKTDEPFILAQRACSRAYEQWKKRLLTEEDDEKKGSP